MHSYFASCPEFACDDAEDLAAAFAPVPPVVFNIVPGFVPALTHLQAVQLTDYEFLKAVDIALALIIVSDRLAPAYVATPDTARGVRHKSYVEGVRKPSRKLTRADKIAAEDVKWGLRS
jgi:hypothetical protein